MAMISTLIGGAIHTYGLRYCEPTIKYHKCICVVNTFDTNVWVVCLSLYSTEITGSKEEEEEEEQEEEEEEKEEDEERNM